MTISVDIWIRGTEVATTKEIRSVGREPEAWTDEDVRAVLEGVTLADLATARLPKRIATLAQNPESWVTR